MIGLDVEVERTYFNPLRMVLEVVYIRGRGNRRLCKIVNAQNASQYQSQVAPPIAFFSLDG